MAKRQLKYVGHSVPRVDGVDKVTGKAKFVGDIVVPGMLYGKILRSPYPHARIRAIDATEAEALPGVVAVLTAADIDDLNPIYNGRPIIAMHKVRYVGEPVAAVAALDLATAEEALGLIQVDYEELPAVVGIDAAVKKDAPLIHEEKGGNIGTHEQVRRGDADAGFAQSDEIVEDTFTFPMVYHYAMEPHSVIAHCDSDEVTVWSSAQHPFQVRGDIAKLFKLAPAKVRLIINYLGGGYGSKSYTKFEPLVVALARKARQPVRICNSVGESMVTVRRHGARVRIKTGVKRDGTILAREAEIYLDTGGYDDNGPQVTARSATRILGPYWIPNIRTDAYQVYTNTGSAGSYRAIGAPQVIYAGESQIEILAAKLGMDPAELRMKNLLKDRPGAPAGVERHRRQSVLESQDPGARQRLEEIAQEKSRSNRHGLRDHQRRRDAGVGGVDPHAIGRHRQYFGGQHGNGAGRAHDVNPNRRGRADLADGEFSHARRRYQGDALRQLDRIEPLDDADGNGGAKSGARLETTVHKNRRANDGCKTEPSSSRRRRLDLRRIPADFQGSLRAPFR